MNKNYFHIYTGNGKGKTTAAIGIAIRALGAGKKVYFAQFVKGMKYSEVETLQHFYPRLSIHQFGLECFIERQPKEEDIKMAQFGLQNVKKAIETNKYNLLILDEANIALHYNLFSYNELWAIIEQAKKSMEVIVTGRYAPKKLIEKADLVTNMQEVKHYYQQGVKARKGIEF